MPGNTSFSATPTFPLAGPGVIPAPFFAALPVSNDPSAMPGNTSFPTAPAFPLARPGVIPVPFFAEELVPQRPLFPIQGVVMISWRPLSLLSSQSWLYIHTQEDTRRSIPGRKKNRTCPGTGAGLRTKNDSLFSYFIEQVDELQVLVRYALASQKSPPFPINFGGHPCIFDS